MNKRTRITNPLTLVKHRAADGRARSDCTAPDPHWRQRAQVPGNYKSPGTSEAANGIEFKLSEAGGVYTVYMRPNATPSSPNATVSAQVTIKAPHGADAAAFSPSEHYRAGGGTSWEQSSRNDAPAEAPGSDYVSFSVDFPAGDSRPLTGQPEPKLPCLALRPPQALG